MYNENYNKYYNSLHDLSDHSLNGDGDKPNEFMLCSFYVLRFIAQKVRRSFKQQLKLETIFPFTHACFDIAARSEVRCMFA